MALVAFIGNAMLGNINSTLSPTTATGQQNGSTQNLSSNIVATATLGSGNYSYFWNYTGTVVTFTGQTNSTTNVSYASISVAGSSTVSCTVTDGTTGVVVNTTNSCVITWPIQLTPITSVTWSIAGATTSAYNGAAQSVTVVSVVPSGATYSTSTTSATNAGGVASTTITGNGSYSGSFTSPNLTIGTSTITIASSGATSFAFNGASQTVGYTVSGVYAADTNYSVSGTSATNCGSFTVTLSETSSNYTLGTPSTFAWSITPTAPANFTVSVTDYYLCNFSWTAVGGCSYKVWGRDTGGVWAIVVDNIPVGTTTAAYAAATNFNYEFYVVAVASSGTSVASRTAFVYTGRGSYQETIAYNSGLQTLSPLCLSGSAGATSGAVGLKAWVQGTYGVTISSVVANSGTLNFSSSLLYGTATRQAIFWQLNATTTNQLTGASSAPAPWSGNPQTRNVSQATGTVNYYLRIPASAGGGAFPQSTGWSTNNSGGLSGSFWARIVWRNVGTQVVTVPASPPTVTYS